MGTLAVDGTGVLRDDPAPQRTAQAALENAKRHWLNGAGEGLPSDLGRYAAGADLEDCGALQQIMQSEPTANTTIAALIADMVDAVRRNPLGQVPFRHQFQHGLGMLQLATQGNAALSLILYEKGDRPRPRSICFTDSECHEIVLRGSGTAVLLTAGQVGADAVRIERAERPLMKGARISMETLGEAKQLHSVNHTLVVLRLSRTPDSPKTSREYGLSDGKLLHSASGNRADSRHEMFSALLGAMGRSDAAPVLAEITTDGSDQLRWQALRNCLSLNTECGFAALADIASNYSDPLAKPADALKRQLLVSYPQLKALETSLCPA